MKASRPYLIRALHEWAVENSATPYLMVNAEYPQVVVPRQYVLKGTIVLNIDPGAISELKMTNRFVSFSARFECGHVDCYIPIPAVLALYTAENGKGMVFSDDDLGDESEEDGDDDAPPPTTGRRTTGASHLTLVK